MREGILCGIAARGAIETGSGLTVGCVGTLLIRAPEMRQVLNVFPHGRLKDRVVKGVCPSRGVRLAGRRPAGAEVSFSCRWVSIFSITTGSSMQTRACPASVASALGITFTRPTAFTAGFDIDIA